ncbi:MAG TPA: DUF507 family protein [Thermoanaerobaculia bacterium]|nr:DUF507 family protein [Thermoanaerobaculia bacterium]
MIEAKAIVVKINRERVERLARELLEAMTASDAVVLLKDRGVVLQAIAQVLAEEIEREEAREETVRRRIARLRKVPPRRSPDWESLFRRLMEEEYLREGLDG